MIVALLATSCRTGSNQEASKQPSSPSRALGPAGFPPSTKAIALSNVADGSRTTGGFIAEARSTGLIVLSWDNVPGAKLYVVFRSTQPRFTMDMPTVLTMETSSNQFGHELNHWADSNVNANTRYYYAVVADVVTKRLPTATGTCMTPARDGPLRGIERPATRTESSQRAPDPAVGIIGDSANQQSARLATSTPFLAATLPVYFDEARREKLRRKDGVVKVPPEIRENTNDLPKGTYGFVAGLSLDSTNLVYGDDGEHHELFEIHRLSDARYSFVGYVTADTASNLKQAKAGIHFSLYSHRWPGATEIVSIPAEHVRMAGANNANEFAGRYFSSAEIVTMEGEKPAKALGTINLRLDLVWR